MQTVEITNPKEARRCRYAQYRGEQARLMLNGAPVTGMVRAVKEDRSSIPKRWTVTLISKTGDSDVASGTIIQLGKGAAEAVDLIAAVGFPSGANKSGR